MTLLKRPRYRCWPDGYRHFFAVDFAEVQGRIFVVRNRSRRVLKELERSFRKAPPTIEDENTDNHEHFYCFPNDTIQGVRSNHTLAEAVRLAWQEILKLRFPSRRFALFVANEYEIGTDPSAPERITWEEITPTLRLWSLDHEDGAELAGVYRLDENGPEKVLWPERLERLYGLEEIFALIEAGPEHPLKLEAIRSRTTGG